MRLVRLCIVCSSHSLAAGNADDANDAVIVNLAIGTGPSEGHPYESLTDAEKRGVDRANHFATLASAYASMHGTRPATIGLVLSSSPLALLAW